MASPNVKLATSLQKLHDLQKQGRVVVRAADLSRTHLERLVESGRLRSIIRGWYMPCRPEEDLGDTTTWFASMRHFVRGYCDERFGSDWHINAELSLKLHTGSSTLARQIQVNALKGTNNALTLPAGTSMFDLRVKEMPPANQLGEAQGLRALSLEAALVRATPNVWQADTLTMQLALGMLKDTSALNRILLDGDHTTIAGRIAGALRAVDRAELADGVLKTMRSAGHSIVEQNPFNAPVQSARALPESPYCARIKAMWELMREQVMKAWTTPVRTQGSPKEYLDEADVRYLADAYHSLSIEGYQVTPEMIDRVRKGNWGSGDTERDRQERNAMAAKGYFEAHTAVRASLLRVLEGQNPGVRLRADLQDWYLALWSPSVQVGLVKPSELAGWRGSQVFIKNARHTPLPPEAVRDAMPLLFDLLEAETEPCVRAVLGHFVFVFIHPYMDGNGRLARFMMNLMLATGGWPWTVVTLDIRDEYMRALDAASSDQDIKPFTRLLSSLVQAQLIEGPKRPASS
ncbi:Fic family protein [Paucibacter sp. PLA-PC-4]|uniref:Fic family protein n=1 Tax=Paucibacter sp. PLA-PC-4 TaxID=2993655 RepID=UPI0022498579|nr:Fic family protein [Paucibacter sp. PLA-PC-4]MCX2861071.1 Fic family protein [Paucibacter sp. PLA-PC-4]